MNASTQMFLLALAAMVGGVVLTMTGQTEAGMLLLGAAVGWLTSGGMAKKKEAAGLLLCFLLPVLASSCTPGKAYVAADLATYEAIAPAYAGYVGGDPGLSQAQRDRRLRTLAAWKIRIDKAGGGK